MFGKRRDRSGTHIKQAMDGLIRSFSEHPEKAHSSDSAATAAIEAGLRCRVTSPRGWSLLSDMPRGLGGGGAAPSPGWLSRAALAACDATVIAMRAAQLGLPLGTLQVTVDSESDDRGLLGMDETIAAGPLSARVRVRIGADGVAPERLRELVAWAEAHSPVGDALRRAVPTRTEVEIA